MVVTARYYRVSPQYWHLSRDWEDRLRLLGLYVQTCEHRTTEGLYRLPLAYVNGDLGWPIKTVEHKLADLQTTGFIKYDAGAEVLLLLDALQVQPPTSEPQIKGAIARLRSVPATPLLLTLLDLAETHASGLAKAIREEIGLHSPDLSNGNVTALPSHAPTREGARPPAAHGGL